jgi:hypothetical protein
MTKPSVDQINKYLSVVNTGVKSNDLVQIHPIVNTQSNLKNKMGSSTYAKNNSDLIVDTSVYPSYDQVSEQFAGLQITDFPLYVQGLDQYSESSPVIKQNRHQADSTVSQQEVNNLNEFLKVNSIQSRSAVPVQ